MTIEEATISRFTDMDVIRLRTLTEKSKLGFGKHAELTVYELIALEPDYLVWVYYNSSNITFTDLVLDQLAIRERINKPGRLPTEEARKAVNRWVYRDVKEAETREERNKRFAMTRDKISARIQDEIILKMKNDKPWSKGKMQAANQGHINIY